jgi:ATP-binding cassette subfamily B protein
MDSENKSFTLKEFIAVSGWAVKLLFRVLPVMSVMRMIVTIAEHLDPLIYTLIFAFFIDSVTQIKSSTDLFSQIAFPLALFGIYFVISKTFGYLSAYIDRVFDLKGRFRVRELLCYQLHDIGIQELEDPTLANKIHRTTNTIQSMLNFSDKFASIIAKCITVVTVGVMIWAVSPIAVPIFVILLVPRIMFYNHYLKKDWEYVVSQTEGYRKALEDIGEVTTVKRLHEIEISGAFPFFMKRFSRFGEKYSNDIEKLQIMRNLWGYGLDLINLIIIFWFLYGYIDLFAQGQSTIGTLTIQFRNLTLFTGTITMISAMFTAFWENSIKIKDAYDIFTMKRTVPDGTIVLEKKNTPPLVTLENVSFSYPRSEKVVLDHIDLHIAPGEKIAIVGHNGAGKTTLVRLLTRLYTPQVGKITIDSHDLRDISIHSWYANVGVLLQEYNTYEHLTLKENVAIGDSTKRAMRMKIKKALKLADAISFTKDYANGLSQVMGEKYAGGTRPSTGQWQKIAIARFFYRNAPFVIFDEPTSAIDPMSEFRIFNSIYDSFKGKTVIIISHRFSTVRNADRIIVLDKGKIIEQGNHEQLLALNGVYADAFNVQAEGYK